MADLQATIERALRDAVRTALGEDYADTDPLVRPAGDPKFGDYQANVAMSLAKPLKQKPRDIAQRIIDALTDDREDRDLFAQVEPAGPGFINMTLTDDALARQAGAMRADENAGIPRAEAPQTVVVDYSSPNVAKEMHVGHLRSTIIGDAIARILEARGHCVVRQNHLGDWGTQFGMLIEYLIDQGYDLAADVQDAPAGDRDAHQIGDLNRLYQQAKQKFDDDADFAERARQRVVALQQGDARTLKLWRGLVEESKRHFNDVYQRLGVALTDDDIRGESAYNDALSDAVEALDKTGLLTESQGATCVFPEGFTDRDGEPLPLIVRKKDGGYLYATTDLAAARFRINQLGAQRIIYVTDARQDQHFQMVFQTLRQAGWAPEQTIRLDHVTFGTILGPDKKPFKTRAGETVRLSDLLDEAEERATRVVREKGSITEPQRQAAIARIVGIGALKYADLSNDRVKDYVFDWDRMLAMDGNTAPYLQYSYTRIRSIFRKGEIDPATLPDDAVRVAEPAERALVLKLAQWPTTIAAVGDHLQPHRLCTFLYELATAYHRFYEQCPVLTAPDRSTMQSRLALCDLVARTLRRGLGLLGIDVVEQM